MTGIFVAWSDQPHAPGWIEDGTGCEIWIGASNGSGYGRAWVDGRAQMVHRMRYEREIGPIPDGMELDHFACDNGAGGCCNPRHCRPVTPRENQLRGDTISSQNSAKTHCPHGHPLDGRDNRGSRYCKTCKREWMRRDRAEKKLNRRERTCGETHHIGPRVESELLRNAGHPWALLAHCAACGSTVARERIAGGRAAVAMMPAGESA